MSKKAKSYTFLKPKGDSGASKQVSARIPQSVYDSFTTAQEIAAKNGMDLAITDVMIIAMKNAIREVQGSYPDDCQGDLLADE